MFLFFLPILLLLGGCVSIPQERTARTLSVSPCLDRTIDAGLAQDVVVEALIPCRWWEIFANPSLSSLIETALSNNPGLQEAMAKVENARNEARVKRAALFPMIGLDAKANCQHFAKYGLFRAFAPTFPSNFTEYTIDLDFTYEFDFWGKRRNIYRSALGEAQAREAEKAQADLLISTAVAAAYFKLQANMRQVDVLLHQQTLLTELVELRKRRELHALDDVNQVLAAENFLYMVQQQLVIGKQNIEIDKHLLLNLLGEGPDEEVGTAQISMDEAVRVPIPEFLACDLLAYRPDLMAQIWRVEAAVHEVGAAKADFYPNVNLNALGGVDSVFFEKLFTKGSLSYSIAPALHLPIFTAGRIKANLEAKRNILVEEIMRYNRLLLTAAQEVADRMSDLRAADQNLSWQSAIVQNRQESSQVTERRLIHGLGDMLAYLEANLDVSQQEWLEASSQYQYYLAAIQLMRALGGGYQSPRTPITPQGGINHG